MSSIIQSLVTNATDPKIAFAAATLFGYCLYKLMVMTNKPNVQQLEGSDKIDNNIVSRHVLYFFRNVLYYKIEIYLN